MKITIKNRFNGAVIFETELDAEYETELFSVQLGAAVKIAVGKKIDLSDSNMSGSDLRGSRLSYAIMSGSDLSGSNLSGANLCGSDLRDSKLIGANLSGSDLRDSNLSGSDLSGAIMSGSDLSGAIMSGSDLRGSDLRYSRLSGSDLSGSDMRYANLSGAKLSGANFEGVNLDYFKQDLIAEILKLPNEIDALRNALVAGKIDGSTYSGDCACLAGTLAKVKGVETGLDIDCGKFTFRADADAPREQWFMSIRKGDTPETNTGAKKALEWIDEAIAIRDNIQALTH